MKKIAILLIAILLGFNISNAQDNGKNNEEKINFDIHSIVKSQIKEAELKLKNQKNKSTQIISNEITTQKSSQKIPNESSWLNLSNFSFGKGELFPIFLLIEVLLIGTILAIWFKSRRIPNGKNDVELKEVVRKMRTERIGSKTDPEFSALRATLSSLNINISDGGKSITNFARKKKIAKGELHLAIKLRMLANMYK
jgi:competence protein ComGC